MMEVPWPGLVEGEFPCIHLVDGDELDCQWRLELPAGGEIVFGWNLLDETCSLAWSDPVRGFVDCVQSRVEKMSIRVEGDAHEIHVWVRGDSSKSKIVLSEGPPVRFSFVSLEA